MLLQSGLTFGASEQLTGQHQRIATDHQPPPAVTPAAKTMGAFNRPVSTGTAPAAPIVASAANDVSRYVDMVQDSLKEGWSVHAAKDGRLYYCK